MTHLEDFEKENFEHQINDELKRVNMRPGATKGTLRRENKNLLFDVLCLITFH